MSGSISGSMPGPMPGRSAILALAGAGFAFLDQIVPAQGFELVAFAATVGFLALSLSRLGKLALGLLGASLLASLVFVATGHGLAEYEGILSRCVYLPALVTVLVPLRLVAMQSPMIGTAGRHIVGQPPSRRYAFLTLGGQIFGVLLNIGGLLLLAQVALRDLVARARDERLAQIQTRRISTAVLRSFAATMFWSPLGLGLNLLLTIVPGASWTGFLPWGASAAAVFLGLGWLLDRIENPVSATGPGSPARPEPRGLLAIFGLLLILVSITGFAALAEWLAGIPFRGALLLAIPLFACGWYLTGRRKGSLARPEGGALPATLAETSRRANETAIIFAASYLGLMVAAVIPDQAVVDFANSLGLAGASLAAAVAMTVFITSAMGLSPLVSATICVTAVVSAGLAISSDLLMLATLTGWALAILVSPAVASVNIVAGVVERGVVTVGILWNLKFTLAVMVVAAAVLLAFAS